MKKRTSEVDTFGVLLFGEKRKIEIEQVWKRL
nr:MAG TPA: hypothetical protein [Caudoviricetes sp.]